MLIFHDITGLVRKNTNGTSENQIHLSANWIWIFRK